ncbi:PEGA domain-containing protein [Haliangium sp.]|uniref:PEGA domain-containing protein n=1 Tax=Haliangium sp. TaxID=2663208 RepID=UPI003D0F9127
MRRRSGRWAALIATAIAGLIGVGAGPAWADDEPPAGPQTEQAGGDDDSDGAGAGFEAPDPRRAVAVLGFRAGADELPGIDQRLAAILRDKTSLEVLDVTDARRRFGNRLDGAVVDCAGDVACIARIGRRLRVADVLLVGVSRFGDVILTLQRIDVGGAEVDARIAEALAPDQAPDTDKLLTYLRRVMPDGDFLRYGVIRIQANIAGAEVIIGGTSRGRTPLDPVRLPAPASYDIRIASEGYVPFEASAAVPPDSEVLVRASLARQESAWYKRWWVWTLVGVAAVAGGTTAYLLTRDDDVPVVIEFPP